MGGRGTGVFLKGSEEEKKISLKNAGMKKMVEWGTPTQKRKEYQVLIKKYRLGRERKEPVKKIIKIAFRYEIAKKKREEEKN